MVAPGSVYYVLLKPKLVPELIKDFQQYNTYCIMTLRNIKLIQTITIQTNKWAQFYEKIILQNTNSYMFLPYWFTVRQHEII